MSFATFMFQPGGRLRSGWRILLYVVLTALTAQLALWLYYAAGEFRFPRAVSGSEHGNLMLLDVLLCLAALGPAFILIRYVDLRRFGALGFSFHGRVGIECAQGILASAAMVTAIWVAELLSGSGRFLTAETNLESAVCNGAAYLLTFTFAAALEEILARGYVFQALIEGTGRTVAVTITSGLFGLGHAINPHATALSIVNTVLAGVWLATAYLETRSLWLPTVMHISWNFFLAYVFGFPVSGLRLGGPLFQLQATGPDWVTGGAYGPEGGVLCTAVLVISTAWIAHSRLIHPSPYASALWLPPDTGLAGAPAEALPAQE